MYNRPHPQRSQSVILNSIEDPAILHLNHRRFALSFLRGKLVYLALEVIFPMPALLKNPRRLLAVASIYVATLLSPALFASDPVIVPEAASGFSDSKVVHAKSGDGGNRKPLRDRRRG